LIDLLIDLLIGLLIDLISLSPRWLLISGVPVGAIVKTETTKEGL